MTTVRSRLACNCPCKSGPARASADYAAVRKLHADFHKCASKVIECVGQGDKAQADVLMADDYAKISGDLTTAMMKWKAAAQ